MISIEEVVPRAMKGIIPDLCKGKSFVKAAAGMHVTIIGVAINTYQARGEDGDELYTNDDKPIYNRTGYALYDNGMYSTYKGYTAIEQLISCAPDVLDSDTAGTTETKIEPVRVEIVTKTEKYGKKEYDYLAFRVE